MLLGMSDVDPRHPDEPPETGLARKAVVYGSIAFAAVVGICFVIAFAFAIATKSWVIVFVMAACLIAFPIILRLPFWDKLKMWFGGIGGGEAGGRGVLRRGPDELAAMQQAQQQSGQPPAQQPAPAQPSRHHFARLRKLLARRPRSTRSGRG